MPSQNNGIMKIAELGIEERPREKMLAKGPAALSSAELIAVIIGSGSGGLNAVEVGQELLRSADWRLSLIAARSPEALSKQIGVGKAYALKISAAFELGRRFLEEGSGAPQIHIRTPRQVYNLMLPTFKGLDHEEFWIVCLNSRCRVTGKVCLTKGGEERTTVDLKQISRLAIEKKASNVVIVHNHPTGDPTPSKMDISETAAIRNALEAVDIGLLDHVIISDTRYFSFNEDTTFEA